MNPNTLSRITLNRIPSEIPVPTYLHDSPTVGIVHIGVGNFHRSHQAMYTDRLLSMSPHQPFAICGIGVRTEDQPLIETLRDQDGLYSLSLFDTDGSIDIRIIGALREFILASDNLSSALDRLANPNVRVVSLTITESGYVEDPSTGRRAADDPKVMSDAANNFVTPQTAFGLIVAALRARRRAGTLPFTVLSCDNIQGNGVVARRSVVETARLVDEGLADWIDENVGFPNTMVDRITPRASQSQIDQVSHLIGVRDNAAVIAEPFTQWILEDDFRSGRPEWEKVGAIFTNDIRKYEAMKLRLLNGAHPVIA